MYGWDKEVKAQLDLVLLPKFVEKRIEVMPDTETEKKEILKDMRVTNTAMVILTVLCLKSLNQVFFFRVGKENVVQDGDILNIRFLV